MRIGDDVRLVKADPKARAGQAHSHRAALTRQRRVDAQATRDAEIQRLLEAALRVVDEGKIRSQAGPMAKLSSSHRLANKQPLVGCSPAPFSPAGRGFELLGLT